MFAAAKKRKLNRRTILDYYDVIRFEKKLILFSKIIAINKKGFIFAAA